jgi:hypothetical protein
VALIMRGDQSGNLHLFYSQRVQEFYYALEAECARAGLLLASFAHHVPSNRFYGPAGEPFSLRAIAQYDCLGVLAFPTGVPGIWLSGVVSLLSDVRKPLAILDESDSGFLREQAAVHPGMRLFELGMGPLHGALMGAFLAGLGHRRAAYLSTAHQAQWSRNREEGLLRAFHSRGGALETYTREEPAPLVHRERLAEVTAGTIAALTRFASPDAQPGPDELAALIAQLHTQARECVDLTVPRHELRELFETALQDDSLTAWVCGNDMMAHEALAFLADHGVPVPGQISVAGFDDTDREFRQNLTSYNHNIPAIVRQMLGHVLDWPPARRGQRTAADHEVPGFVNARRTTARPG